MDIYTYDTCEWTLGDVESCLLQNFRGMVEEASMHVELPQFRVVRIWAQFIMNAVKRFEKLQGAQARRAFVPWIHAHWVDRVPLMSLAL